MNKAIFMVLVLVIFNAIAVNSDEFIIDLEIINGDLVAYPGGTVRAEMTTFISDTERVYEVLAHYFITDEKGYVINEGSKTYAVIHKTTSIIELGIPNYVKPDNYIFKVVAEYNNVRTSDSKEFIVSKRPRFERPLEQNNLIALVIALIMLVILITVLFYQNRKLNKVLRRIKRIELSEFMEKEAKR